jgi:hypothetical protein
MPHPDGLRVLLLDADGSLFPSEAPAFDASAHVTNRFLAELGIQTTYTPQRLLATTTGKNFPPPPSTSQPPMGCLWTRRQEQAAAIRP